MTDQRETLNSVMEEIQAIIRRHSLSGCVTLSSPRRVLPDVRICAVDVHHHQGH